jgi:hypothetical protein
MSRPSQEAIDKSRVVKSQEWSIQKVDKDGFGGINRLPAYNIHNSGGIVATLFTEYMTACRIVAAHNASLKL